MHSFIHSINIPWESIVVHAHNRTKRQKSCPYWNCHITGGERQQTNIKQDVLDIGNCKWEYAAFPGGANGKEPTCHCRKQETLVWSLGWEDPPWKRKWQPTSIFLSGESHGQRSPGSTVHRVAKSQTWLKRLTRDAGKENTHTVSGKRRESGGIWVCGYLDTGC